MGEAFQKITVPDVGDDGLSKPQTDKLLIEMGGGMNFLGGVTTEHCKKIEELEVEIKGKENYLGLKGKVASNTRLLNWILKALVVTTAVEGSGIGVLGFKMLNGG